MLLPERGPRHVDHINLDCPQEIKLSEEYELIYYDGWHRDQWKVSRVFLTLQHYDLSLTNYKIMDSSKHPKKYIFRAESHQGSLEMRNSHPQFIHI